eukprot:CAMPEP_0175597402 /NCGR_PEP_ID=MMETSP0096-20121207/56018_1 /TAXON_ID=311494 /ORGANISM="Alexandrium monilatum, Strain CCMP3105" /LENGTH=32 /DNA_ID= /DNA_START= /DNA_END= /DNA_ORIENTATION=
MADAKLGMHSEKRSSLGSVHHSQSLWLQEKTH